MPNTDYMRHGSRPSNGEIPAHPQLLRPGLDENVRKNSAASSSSGGNRSRAGSGAAPGQQNASAAQIPEERPIASGGNVSVSVHLAEPVLYLQGFDSAYSANTAMLRGQLHIKVTKSAKIKAVNLKFRGTATTKWPEGIPPKKTEFEETSHLMTHTWPFFNAQFSTSDNGTGADISRLANAPTDRTASPALGASPMNSNVNLPLSRRRSFDGTNGAGGEHSRNGSVTQKGYRTFHPGDYIYNFELPIDSRLPETIDVELGSVKYELEASIERSGAFRANLLGTKEVTIIRAPAEGSLEHVEPIAISRNWEDQLHYDIVISGKSFPLGSKVPIAFKLTPLAKVQCHRIKVFITENIEYFCSNKRVHRLEPTRKIQLFEKRSDQPGSSAFPGSSMRVTAGGGVPYGQRERAARGEDVQIQDPANLLGRLENESSVGPTEMEFSIQLPGCAQSMGQQENRANRLHFDTTYQNIQVHHWIKIVMRLSRPDSEDPTKRRHFEISIDSPFHILSCRATQANTELPSYSGSDQASSNTNLAQCGCPGAPKRRISPTHIPTVSTLNNATGPSAGNMAMPAGVVADGRLRAASEGSNTSGFINLADRRAAGSGPQRLVLDENGLPTVVPVTTNSPQLARPQPAHVHTNTPAIQRPMHMLRAPSFNPPPFEEEEPPPPLVTPPPQYNDIASPSSGLADYFTRLADAYDDDDSGDDARSVRSGGAVNVPLTPGGRVNRSMEMRREWLPSISQ